MGNPNQRIIVVEKEKLFGVAEKEYPTGRYFFEGFSPAWRFDYESRILSNIQVMRRGSDKEPEDHPEGNAERDPRFKQPIGYMLIMNPLTKKVFVYQRSSDGKKYTETRLQGKFSWGIGGHVEPSDRTKGNLITESRLRELGEEVELEKGIHGEPKVLGYIYHDFDVHQVHFGILYGIETLGNVKPKDPEIAFGEMMSLSELEKICYSPNCEVEEWSRTALEPLRKLL